MQRPAVIGVPRAAAPAASRTPMRLHSFEQAQALTVGLAVGLAACRWLCVGPPKLELLLLVPFWFLATPVLAWAGGLGVSYWCKASAEFLAIDADAHPVLAKVVLTGELVASACFAVALFVVRIADCGG